MLAWAAEGNYYLVCYMDRPGKSAAAISPDELKELKLIDEEKPEYKAKVEAKGKLLGVIPATIEKEYRISAESGDVAGIDAPWWGALFSEG